MMIRHQLSRHATVAPTLAYISGGRSHNTKLAFRALATGLNNVSGRYRALLRHPKETSYTAPLSSMRIFSRHFAVTELPLPPLGAESITEGTIMEWQKKVGDAVKKGEIIVVIETDKVVVEVESTLDGVITKLHGQVDDTVAVGTILASIDSDGVAAPAGEPAAAPAGAPAAAPAAPAATPSATPAPPKDDGKASLEAGFQKAAADRAGGAAPSAPAAAAPAAKAAAAPAAAAVPTPKVPGSRNERREKMTRMRSMIATRLKDAQNTAAMLTTFNEVDMSAAMDLRKTFKDEFEKTHNTKFGFMSMFIKASSLALQELPAVNAVIDDKTNEVVYRDYVDVSVAVASPRGLVVPVLRNVENMSFNDIERELALLAEKARSDKITMDDMTGGTFTISNGGVFGSMMGTPIINPPQSAILGMHAIKDRAVVINKEVKVRPVMYLALTYDHRLVDGREAVTFLVNVKNKMEDPRRMLLDL